MSENGEREDKHLTVMDRREEMRPMRRVYDWLFGLWNKDDSSCFSCSQDIVEEFLRQLEVSGIVQRLDDEW